MIVDIILGLRLFDVFCSRGEGDNFFFHLLAMLLIGNMKFLEGMANTLA